MENESKKIKQSILKEDFKLPTAVQIRKYIKQKSHLWNDLDRIVIPGVLLPEDILLIHSSEATIKEKYGEDFDIEGRRTRAQKRVEYLDDCIIQLQKSSFDYNVAIMSPQDELDENGIPLIVKAEIRITEDRKRLLDFIKQIDKYRYKD